MVRVRATESRSLTTDHWLTRPYQKNWMNESNQSASKNVVWTSKWNRVQVDEKKHKSWLIWYLIITTTIYYGTHFQEIIIYDSIIIISSLTFSHHTNTKTVFDRIQPKVKDGIYSTKNKRSTRGGRFHCGQQRSGDRRSILYNVIIGTDKISSCFVLEATESRSVCDRQQPTFFRIIEITNSGKTTADDTENNNDTRGKPCHCDGHGIHRFAGTTGKRIHWFGLCERDRPNGNQRLEVCIGKCRRNLQGLRKHRGNHYRRKRCWWTDQLQ